jgi:hypothetical protein
MHDTLLNFILPLKLGSYNIVWLVYNPAKHKNFLTNTNIDKILGWTNQQMILRNDNWNRSVRDVYKEAKIHPSDSANLGYIGLSILYSAT